MPGIVGLVTKMPRERAEPQLRQMVETLRHEAFYRTGTWIDESLGVYVGWTALSGSFGAQMPVSNETGDIILVFSGEDYAGRDTVLGLKHRGHDVESDGPSYLVHLAEEERDFPAGLNGRFHGLLVNVTHKTATLFNDRYGMQQIVYFEGRDAFYFAAEAKAILAVRPELRTVDPRALGELVSCGCAMEDRTLFKDIHLLPAGGAWVFRDGLIERRTRYFEPRQWERQETLDGESYYTEIRRLFSQNLRRYFVSSQTVGMSLTGGLDTRMIMAWQEAEPGLLPCYTFGGTYRECRDVTVAREVARVCRQPYDVIRVGEAFLAGFPYFAERTVYLSDGRADVSRSPALYANVKAREVAPVRMTGVYGSEILRRLRNFKPAGVPEGLFDAELLSQTDAARMTYETLLRLHPVSFTAFHQTPQRGVDGLEQSQIDVRYPFLDNDIVRTSFCAPGMDFAQNDLSANNDVCLRLIADGSPKISRIPTDRGLGGSSRSTWAALSRALLSFSFKAEYAYDYGMPQSVARMDHLFSVFHLERLFLGRHKFAHFRVWYRDALRRYVQDMLLDSRALARPYVQRRGVESVVRGHLKGVCNYTNAIHQLLSLELLHRLFIDQNA